MKYLLKKAGADVITGEATLKADRVVSCGGKDYQGKYVVIATGSVPMMIPVPGHELCIDSTGALNLPSLPRSMVVMGGGVIGLELACAFAAYGTEITVVEMMPELMPREQKEAVRIVVNAMKKQGIALKTGAKMLRIEKNGGLLRAVYEIEGKEEYTDCEQVLMAAGRKTNLSGIDAEALGLELDRKKCIVVDKYQHTSLPGVYAIGDVVGGYQLAHAAYAEGEAALADMLGEDKPYGTQPVPVCTYTIPCFASVGLTTESAKDAGYEPVMGSFDYSANGMALAEGASGQRVRHRRQGDDQDAGRDDRGREFLRDDRHGDLRRGRRSDDRAVGEDDRGAPVPVRDGARGRARRVRQVGSQIKSAKTEWILFAACAPRTL